MNARVPAKNTFRLKASHSAHDKVLYVFYLKMYVLQYFPTFHYKEL